MNMKKTSYVIPATVIREVLEALSQHRVSSGYKDGYHCDESLNDDVLAAENALHAEITKQDTTSTST